MTTAVVSRGRVLVPILLAIAVGVSAYWFLDRAAAFAIGDDTIRDQLMARDCAELDRCHLIGAPTSVPGFVQGAVWLDLLIAVRLLGGDVAALRTAVLAMLGISVSTLVVVVWRWLRPSMALPAAALLIWTLCIDPYPSLLTNPSPSALPDVLAAAGLLCFALSGRRRFLILAAFAVGVAINVHVAAFSLLPSLVIVAMLGRPRPWRSLLVAAVVCAAVSLATSRAALFGNLSGLAAHVALPVAVAAGLALAALSAASGASFRRLSRDARAWIIGWILVLPFGLAALWLVLHENHHFGIIYTHPLVGPAAALAAAVAVLPFEVASRRLALLRWLPTACALAALIVVAERPVASPPSRAWTFAEAAAIEARAAERGWGYEDLVFRLQGRACRELVAAIAVAAPPPGPPSSRGRRQLQVIRTSRAAAAGFAKPEEVVALGGANVAIVREIESWLQPASLVACRLPLDSGRDPVCSDPMRTAPDKLTPERFLFLTRSFPGIHSMELQPPYIASYRIPLAPLAGESRDLALVDPVLSKGCEWRFAHVEGVGVADASPGRRLRLHSEDGAPGLVVVEKPFGTAACEGLDLDMRYPPCVIETLPGEALEKLSKATFADRDTSLARVEGRRTSSDLAGAQVVEATLS